MGRWKGDAYRSNCNVKLTAMHRLKPGNPNSHEGSITA